MNKNVDTVGLRCPEPLMIARREMRRLAPGDTLTVTADDPAADRDFELLCLNMGYRMLSKTREDRVISFVMQK